MVKSPLTTPFPTSQWRQLLDITWHRNVSKGGYGMVAQLRSWLPDAIGGVYWLYLDNQYISTYVPIHAGVREMCLLTTLGRDMRALQSGQFRRVSRLSLLVRLRQRQHKRLSHA